LRKWQEEALLRWDAARRRGIVAVVTGGGKTIFALACIAKIQADTSLIVVPSIALLDQWWEEAAAFFRLKLDEVHVITGKRQMRTGTINLAVLNTASKLHEEDRDRPCFLIVDECHKAASAQFKAALDVPTIATLGLSATPERPYDEGLAEVLVPALGPVIYEYTYSDALRDGVIVPFILRNIIFDLEEDRQTEYDRLTKAVARAISKYGHEADETVALLLRRARVLSLSLNRIRLALKLVSEHRGRRILIFHEDIEACDLIFRVLVENGMKGGVYHSKLSLRQRAQVLADYRCGAIEVLVTCRALDEGFNVPETQVGIIAASTATRRQRIQRLGRVLRPAGGKNNAIVYTLVATTPEINRLREEEQRLEGVAEVAWSRE
jgi:superfamily II DNA or RNA helicase